MDNIAEQIVVRTRTTGDTIKFIGIMLGTILLSSAFMFLAIWMGFFSFVIPAVLLLFLGVYLVGGMNVEYEYIVTNNEMDIDKIIGRRKRKRMITVDLSQAEEFAVYPPENDVDADATVHASSGLEKDAHYLVVKHSSYGKVKVIFNPNEKIRTAIISELPRSLQAKIKHGL